MPGRTGPEDRSDKTSSTTVEADSTHDVLRTLRCPLEHLLARCCIRAGVPQRSAEQVLNGSAQIAIDDRTFRYGGENRAVDDIEAWVIDVVLTVQYVLRPQEHRVQRLAQGRPCHWKLRFERTQPFVGLLHAARHNDQRAGREASPTSRSTGKVAKLADLRLPSLRLRWIRSDDGLRREINPLEEGWRADYAPKKALASSDLHGMSDTSRHIRVVNANPHLQKPGKFGIGLVE